MDDMSTSEPLVSILTPVYNGEKMLAKVIEGVLAQDYQNWEYIIVDNHSTDRTREIADGFAVREPRVRVVTNQKLLEVIANHNEALKYVSPGAKYVKFVQGSFVLFPECVREMVAVAEKNHSTGVVCSIRLYGNKVFGVGLPYPSDFMRGRDIARWALLHEPYVFGSPSTMLFRADVTRSAGNFLNVQNIHADEEVMYEIFKSHDFSFLYKILSYSPWHEGRESIKSGRLNTYILGRLLVMTKYGREYLTPIEYEQRLATMLWRYYRFLGMAVLQRRDREFWELHRAWMDRIGLPISNITLAKGLLGVLLGGLLDIRNTYNEIARYYRRR
jgi:glycosyltransferase involved in cell wall biosynthesis